MNELLQYVITGLALGVVYSLIALSFVVVWKSTGVANLAIGQIVLFSSWFAYGMLVQAGLPVWAGIPLVIIFAIALGWLIERIALRPMIAQPTLSLIAVTLGLGYFFEGLVGIIWPKSLASLPPIFPQEPVHIGTAVIKQEFLWAAVISLILFGLLTIYFRYHKMGIAMRATADDQKAVQACGIPVTRIFSQSWMFACVLAAVGGILVSSIGNISKAPLIETGLQAFSVVILGGLNSFLGVIIAGPLIGLAETMGGGYLTNVTWEGIREVIPYIIIIIVMFIKPYGLFGENRIERI
ncbi:MAG: branched-chain amino acid ABC transporter permease [Chloroflexi bacterium]|nr:branched-chain amino acid ABC transporter permease [Chloroflexota bacterium]